MELQTRQFGRVSYERHDVLEVSGFESADSSWLLLADKSHPHLYWLQSTSDSSRAIPLCSLVGTGWMRALRITNSHRLPAWMIRASLIALAEIRDEASGCSLDLQHPILIDPHALRGLRLRVDDDQTLQYELSEKVAPLRKCA